MRRHTPRASKSDQEGETGQQSSISGAASVGDESPYTASSFTNGAISSVLGTHGDRRESIPVPGYMTEDEEYFRLVVMAAKLNVSGTSTPSTIDEPESLSHLEMMDSVDEVNEADTVARIFDERWLSERVAIPQVA